MCVETLSDMLNTLAQRVRLHIINCPLHSEIRVLEFFEGQASFNLDCFDESAQDIVEVLTSSKYIPYACILIMFNTECECRPQVLRAILEGIERNRYLRYKTKLILSGYNIGSVYRRRCSDSGIYDSISLTLDKYSVYNKTIYSSLLMVPQKRAITGGPSSEATDEFRTRRSDLEIFLEYNIQNIQFMQVYVKGQFDLADQMDSILYWLDIKPLTSMNELLERNVFQRQSMVQTSSHAELYFYNINPALAIIVNNYYFTTRGVRKGSEQDVRRLIRELKVAQIPFILVQDCSRREFSEILEYIQRKDFKPLKSFLFFVMSHGGANNAIYTDDGQLDLVEDIVKCIQANKSLEGAEKLIVPNACRGRIDLECADYDDLEQIQQFQPTHARFLDNNTVVLCSVPEGVMSPRHRQFGSPFMKSFCRNFRQLDHTQDIRYVEAKIDNDLKKVRYYEDLDKCSDLVVSDASRKHYILHLPAKAQEMLLLFESIVRDFSAMAAQNLHSREGLQLQTLFCLSGNLKKVEVSQEIAFVEQYSTPDLDKDECTIDGM